jgi:hypothetical protein
MPIIEKIKNKPFLIGKGVNYAIKNKIKEKEISLFPIILPKYAENKYLKLGNFQYCDRKIWEIDNKGLKFNYLDTVIGNKYENMKYFSSFFKYMYVDEFYEEKEVSEVIFYAISSEYTLDITKNIYKNKQLWEYRLELDDELLFHEIKNPSLPSYKGNFVYDNLDYELYNKVLKSI